MKVIRSRAEKILPIYRYKDSYYYSRLMIQNTKWHNIFEKKDEYDLAAVSVIN